LIKQAQPGSAKAKSLLERERRPTERSVVVMVNHEATLLDSKAGYERAQEMQLRPGGLSTLPPSASTLSLGRRSSEDRCAFELRYSG
jgi:hypothetical protein